MGDRRLLARLMAALGALLVTGGLGVAAAPAATAHPLGNFTVNYYSGIRVGQTAITVDVVVDRAEIPTIQALPDAAVGRDPANAQAWSATECAGLAQSAQLTVDGTLRPLTVESARLHILSGAAGLATSRLECSLQALAGGSILGTQVTYQAPATGGRVGWHEVTAAGDGVALTGSDVPAVSSSQQLSSYPQDLLASPLDQRFAAFTVAAGSSGPAGAKGPGPLAIGPLRGLDGLTTAYTDLVARTDLTPGFAALAVVLAMVLGALHAFAPGHGKTLMAAYLVGRSGTWRQAAVIGISVTVTHTVGVLLLGVALSAAAIAAPETAYRWLGLASGLLLAGIGVTLLRTARRRPGAHVHGPGGHTHGPIVPPHDHPHALAHDLTHDHNHEHDHDHAAGRPAHELAEHDHLQLSPLALQERQHPHQHQHPPTHEHHLQGSSVQRAGLLRHWRLAAVGLVGGMVPSPSALLVLLGGIAIGRAWFGVLLVLVYGMGMASALVGTGLLLVLARDRFDHWSGLRQGRPDLPGLAMARQLSRQIPLLTALIVIGLGLWIAARSLAPL